MLNISIHFQEGQNGFLSDVPVIMKLSLSLKHHFLEKMNLNSLNIGDWS